MKTTQKSAKSTRTIDRTISGGGTSRDEGARIASRDARPENVSEFLTQDTSRVLKK